MIADARKNWRFAGLLLVGLGSLACVLYQQTLDYLFGFWNLQESGEYAHGYLVLAISVYLVIRNRKALASIAPRPDLVALPAVATLSVLWMLAVLIDVQVVQAVLLLLLLLAIIWTALGFELTRKLAFPVLFIGFAIPVWFPLSPVLQNVTADVVFYVVRLIKIPAFRQENMIVLPAGTLSIEEACSGLRYFLAALILGTLYAYLSYRSIAARLLVVLIAGTAGILANIVRVFIIVYLGYVTDMQHPIINDHLMLGWYLFGGFMAIMLVVESRLAPQPQADDSIATDGVQADNPALTDTVTVSGGRYLLQMLAGAVLISTGPALVHLIKHQPGDDNTTVEYTLPAGQAGWSRISAGDDSWMPLYHGAVVRKVAYRKSDQEVFLYVGYYPKQQQGEELITYHNQISNTDIWQTNYTHASLQDFNGQPILEQLISDKSGDQRLIWYWYNVADRNTASKYEAKLLELVGLLTGKSHSYVTAIAIEVGDDIKQSREQMGEFLMIMQQPLAELERSVNTVSVTR